MVNKVPNRRKQKVILRPDPCFKKDLVKVSGRLREKIDQRKKGRATADVRFMRTVVYC